MKRKIKPTLIAPHTHKTRSVVSKMAGFKHSSIEALPIRKHRRAQPDEAIEVDMSCLLTDAEIAAVETPLTADEVAAMFD